jgi:hypothetical protein
MLRRRPVSAFIAGIMRTLPCALHKTKRMRLQFGLPALARTIRAAAVLHNRGAPGCLPMDRKHQGFDTRVVELPIFRREFESVACSHAQVTAT